MKFPDLLRCSRAVSLARQDLPRNSPDVYDTKIPILQAITAKKCQRFRGDWGAKRKLPILKNRHISIQKFDTFEHQCAFISSDRFVRTLKRIYDLKLPVPLNDYEQISPYLLQKYNTFSSSNPKSRPTLPPGILYAKLKLLDSFSDSEKKRLSLVSFIQTKKVPLPFTYGKFAPDSKECLFGVSGVIAATSLKGITSTKNRYVIRSLNVDETGKTIPNITRENRSI